MTTIVKKKTEVVVPRSIRKQAGIKAGDQLEFKVSSRTITITALEPVYKPTKAEAAAIRKGEAEIARGEVVTLKDLLNDLGHRRRKSGAKATPTSALSRINPGWLATTDPVSSPSARMISSLLPTGCRSLPGRLWWVTLTEQNWVTIGECRRTPKNSR